ncbi:MAG: MATE family efflux transporter [Succinivibrionaceae bacterium]
MYAGADLMIGLMTPDPQIRHLGAEILRIEAWAEPLFAASIVISGVLRGSGDTLLPSCLNFGSMWLVRLPLSFLLAGYLGLYGVWVAMSLELCVRGILLLLRLKNGAWLNKTTHKDLR